MTKNNFGIWEVTVPSKAGVPAIPHQSKIKVRTPPIFSIQTWF
jgi:1,4-alpha-glucan branching enzyme